MLSTYNVNFLIKGDLTISGTTSIGGNLEAKEFRSSGVLSCSSVSKGGNSLRTEEKNGFMVSGFTTITGNVVVTGNVVASGVLNVSGTITATKVSTSGLVSGKILKRSVNSNAVDPVDDGANSDDSSSEDDDLDNLMDRDNFLNDMDQRTCSSELNVHSSSNQSFTPVQSNNTTNRSLISGQEGSLEIDKEDANGRRLPNQNEHPKSSDNEGDFEKVDEKICCAQEDFGNSVSVGSVGPPGTIERKRCHAGVEEETNANDTHVDQPEPPHKK